ncbi:hypothetical protein [Streptomyces sp. NPDC059994]|uniref:hypothetical protein n=1 Tax=Streptomyces sp. NPDC059994 TaxID=3347029 RepID=UPI0036CF064C
MVQDFDVIGFLHTLAEHCVALLDVAAAGVLTVTPGGQLVDAAASDERTRRLELASTEWDEAPCRDCFRTKRQVPDVPLATQAARMRWPRFAPEAMKAGPTRSPPPGGPACPAPSKHWTYARCSPSRCGSGSARSAPSPATAPGPAHLR